MKKVVLSAVAALATITAAPAFAADMPVKAKAPVVAAPPSQWDVLFGVAFTTDYVLRGISQSNHKPAVQGYYEIDYKALDWLTLYTGVWGSSLYGGAADAEFDISGGARFAWGNFGLDLGYVYYYYPEGTDAGRTFGSFGEFYAKGSYKVADWLTIGAVIDGGGNFNDGVAVVGSKTAYYYLGNATVTLPVTLPYGITMAINGELGHQVYDCTGCIDYTFWDIGLDFVYKAVTLDLRYTDTDKHNTFFSPAAYGTKDLAHSAFVATLKFDTSLSALK